MKKIILDSEALLVESFETLGGPSEVFGTVRGHGVYWTNASERPCSRCCPQTLEQPADGEA
ncbi:MAG TPA: hypothetical protein VHG08_24240 [Longimicrobium sp.]|nr:hypothetical protein [Longimicrobium sp.]